MKIFFVGPSPKFVTGQSAAFDLLRQYSQSNAFLLSKNSFFYSSGGHGFFSKTLFFSAFLISFTINVLLQRPDVFYISISRSKAGFLKDLPVFLSAILYKRKIVVHLHGSDFADFFDKSKGVMRKLIFYCYSRVDTAIVMTEGMKTEFESFPMVKIKVVFNCSDNFATLEKSNFSGSFKVLYISNIMKSKGIFELMTAVSELFDMGLDIKLDIAGRFVADEFMDMYQSQETFKLNFKSSCMAFHGVVEGRAKRYLFYSANVVALPSYYKTEAQPIVLIEAMSCGRFILSSKFKYIPEYIKHLENGWLVPEVTVESLKNALVQLNSSKQLMVDADSINRTYYEKNFTRKKHCQDIFSLLLDGMY